MCVFHGLRVRLKLTKLQEENDALVGKHSKHAQQMQEDNIDLPTIVWRWVSARANSAT